eukprot:961320-Rhodomonas_salina.3
MVLPGPRVEHSGRSRRGCTGCVYPGDTCHVIPARRIDPSAAAATGQGPTPAREDTQGMAGQIPGQTEARIGVGVLVL